MKRTFTIISIITIVLLIVIANILKNKVGNIGVEPKDISTLKAVRIEEKDKSLSLDNKNGFWQFSDKKDNIALDFEKFKAFVTKLTELEVYNIPNDSISTLIKDIMQTNRLELKFSNPLKNKTFYFYIEPKDNRLFLCKPPLFVNDIYQVDSRADFIWADFFTSEPRKWRSKVLIDLNNNEIKSIIRNTFPNSLGKARVDTVDINDINLKNIFFYDYVSLYDTAFIDAIKKGAFAEVFIQNKRNNIYTLRFYEKYYLGKKNAFNMYCIASDGVMTDSIIMPYYLFDAILLY